MLKLQEIGKLGDWVGRQDVWCWNPAECRDDCEDIKAKLRSDGVTYQIQWGQGIHGVIIAGHTPTWAEAATEEEALCRAVLKYLDV